MEGFGWEMERVGVVEGANTGLGMRSCWEEGLLEYGCVNQIRKKVVALLQMFNDSFLFLKKVLL